MTDQTTTTGCAFADEGCTCGRPRLQLTEARTDTPHAFRTYLDASEAHQLDARAAAAEQERDDALAELQVERAKVEMLTANLDRYRRDRDEALEARDVLRVQLDDAQRAIVSIKQQRDRLDMIWRRMVSESAAVERALIRAGFERPTFRAAELIDQLAAQRDQAQQLADFRKAVIDDLNAETMVLNDTIRTQAAELEDANTEIRRLFRQRDQARAAVLGSADRRAQEEPASDARRLLDQAIVDGLPLAGGRVRKLLKALRHELVRVDAKRAGCNPPEARP